MLTYKFLSGSCVVTDAVFSDNYLHEATPGHITI